MIEVVGLILGVLGMFGFSRIVRFVDATVGRWWFLLTWPKEKVQQKLRVFMKSCIVLFDNPQNIATFGPPIMVQLFIDFFSASVDKSSRTLLERCVTRWIRLNFTSIPEKIAVPKLGNVLLAADVADRLGVPLVVVRQLQGQNLKPYDPFEGELKPGDHVLLVDDVASDGEFLEVAISELQKRHANVSVLVLVNRLEGTARDKLASSGIQFNPILDEEDSTLYRLLAQSKA
ncbi:hypothetical protein KBY84_08015 [Cyanobium sp. N.Huapi 1H5]|uniref:phosphoribosyltransferase family protein n=1 Tax=Cyanobium sp. N.Huapi 1H5 TaxID=2823719 RepID=UPI0020CE4DB4|nr:phosphoribosyltransferase family protein [Cyanobium sp. N.Huapi 1H5]MCP9837438.1 hypothetical protein [Cyanobium sp. N.Huapi 1H5]